MSIRASWGLGLGLALGATLGLACGTEEPEMEPSSVEFECGDEICDSLTQLCYTDFEDPCESEVVTSRACRPIEAYNEDLCYEESNGVTRCSNPCG